MASNVVVKDIMQKDVKVVNNNTVMQEVVAIMNKFDKDAILVVQSGKPTGIITVKDVLIRAVEAGMPLKTIIARMVYTNPLVTIDENATVEEAAKLMKHWNIKHLPVVDKQGALVGLLDDRANSLRGSKIDVDNGRILPPKIILQYFIFIYHYFSINLKKAEYPAKINKKKKEKLWLGFFCPGFFCQLGDGFSVWLSIQICQNIVDFVSDKQCNFVDA